jgi:Na+-driven multidrug efflux pump
VALTLRSPHDREILRLAVPALGALAAEPLYLLADTAMVGHLGTRQLAALAVAGTLLSGSFTLFNFLTYGTTAQVARLQGAGREREAGRLAAQALWLSAGLGLALMVAVAALAAPLVHLIGASGRTADMAVDYLRLSALGLPAALIALAGQGYLRGVSDLRTPLVILVVANAANVVLGLVFIYVLGLGFIGSALGTVVAQLGMGRRSCGPCSPHPPGRAAPAWPGSARCWEQAGRSSCARRPCTPRSWWPAPCSRGWGTRRSAPTRSHSSCSSSWRSCSTRWRSPAR